MEKLMSEMDDEYWKEKLTAQEYAVCRKKGTEPAFSGEYWDTTTSGRYHCTCCGELLFQSETKFDAGCGWPSFYEAAERDKIREAKDTAHGMIRTEVMCDSCGSHLGHVFPDGPAPTGLRYCINSVSIKLTANDE
jgi:peptide-methionine (R)-S-oxide reductase